MDLRCLNELSFKIRRAIFNVHSSLGPGLLESVYVAALTYELSGLNLSVQAQLGLPVNYNGITLELGFRIDLLVQNEVIVEVKSVETLHDVQKTVAYLFEISEQKVGSTCKF